MAKAPRTKSSRGKTQEPKFTQEQLTRAPKGKKKKKSTGSKAAKMNKSELEKEVRNLRKLLDQDEGSDSMAIAMTKAFLRTALDSVAIAEKAYRDNPHAHNSYALNGLMNQTRELAADLRQLQTVETNRQDQLAKIISTGMRRIGMQALQQVQLIQLEVDAVKDREARKALLKQCKSTAKEITRCITEISISMTEEVEKT